MVGLNMLRAWWCFDCFISACRHLDTARHFPGLNEMSWVKWSEAARNISAEDGFLECGLRIACGCGDSLSNESNGYNTSASLRPRNLPCCEHATRVLVASR
jgi:hypothetical protein